MQIAGYLKTSLIEWPGKISSVIFTQGCNFRCPFCHNANLVVDEVVGFSRIDEERIIADLKERKKWVDTVVITGGEPTLQADLSRFLSRLKQMGFLTMIHTNGTRPDALASILNFKFQILNYVAMDIKGDLDDYGKFVGAQNSKLKTQNENLKLKIKKSMEVIIKSGVEYEFRTTVVPGLHDIKNLISLAEQIKFLTQNAKRKTQNEEHIVYHVSRIAPKWFLQQFRPMNTLDPKFLKIKPYSKEEMEAFQKELQKIIPQTFLRGT